MPGDSMMTEIKIDCRCGTRYAFEVEPENARMPMEVRCPNCGADGTPAANEFLKAQALAQSHGLRMVHDSHLLGAPLNPGVTP